MSKKVGSSSLTLFFTALVTAALLTGCATLFSGTSDEIRFESEPSGAKIMIDGVERAETPAVVNVSRDALNDMTVTLKKEGYEAERLRLQKEFATVAVLNLGNVLFWGIDTLTGAVMKYGKTEYATELEQAESSASLLDKSETYTADVGPKAFSIEELRVDSSGEVIVPQHEGEVIIHDEDKGLAYVVE
ncbi:hypothetical protein BSZ35_18430 [Salinibacter sp. 10B]|uniref:PEGA domain-containing protein n=1 Tax=Salinibacter sp. 10B TaxID=1923971 RepID=UPI000CF46024|nr:PEGA domain-containing protein [Salinibacter sp. 10B]PQJ26905.1 hypothetical protein BSZ35_18430 [Salinibacter sp. 10B]